MKTLTYSISINKPREFVFQKIQDKSVYPDWAKAWGEGMTYEGEWVKGGHMSFFDKKQGGTKVVFEEIIPNETIKARHIAMVNPENIEVELTDEMMEKWLGSEESYHFRDAGDNKTTLEVIMVTDEAFEDMMNAWPAALALFKDICEADPPDTR